MSISFTIKEEYTNRLYTTDSAVDIRGLYVHVARGMVNVGASRAARKECSTARTSKLRYSHDTVVKIYRLTSFFSSFPPVAHIYSHSIPAMKSTHLTLFHQYFAKSKQGSDHRMRSYILGDRTTLSNLAAYEPKTMTSNVIVHFLGTILTNDIWELKLNKP